MKNDQLEYYIKCNISPERQNIEDLEIHYARRKKLYRQCGIPELAFRNAEVLEVGPGGGYNTLAFFQWNCKHVDLVEANPQGIKDMQMLFAEQGITEEKYDMHECVIEKYQTEKRYDIIIAEGFIPNLYNQEEVLDKLNDLVCENGIIVITCGERVNYFVEIIKRLTGRILTQGIASYEEQVKYLTEIFGPQLNKLRGVSKLAEDWVRDNIFNPEINNRNELSLVKAIQYFDENFDVLGTSPQIFTDYSWSKDIWYDYKKDYLEQYDKKRLSLLLANMPEVVLSVEETKVLLKYLEDIVDAEAEYEKTLNIARVKDILDSMSCMEKLVQKNFSNDFVSVFYEIKELLLAVQKSEHIEMSNYPHFFEAFGRTQQYISFVRK